MNQPELHDSRTRESDTSASASVSGRPLFDVVVFGTYMLDALKEFLSSVEPISRVSRAAAVDHLLDGTAASGSQASSDKTSTAFTENYRLEDSSARDISAAARSAAKDEVRRLLMVSVPAPVCRLDAMVRACHEMLDVCWRTPVISSELSESSTAADISQTMHAKAEDWSSIGVGVASEWIPTPERDNATIQEAIGRALSSGRHVIHPRCIAAWDGRMPLLTSLAADTLIGAGPLVPRVFGGLAFDPEDNAEQPWMEFGSGAFLLPRWTYSTDGNSACLTFAMQLPTTVSGTNLVAQDDIAWGSGLTSGEATSSSSVEQTTRTFLAELQRWQQWFEQSRRDANRSELPMFRGERAAQPRVSAPGVEQLAEERWSSMVEQVRSDIRAGGFKKVVLARRADIRSPVAVNIGDVLASLMNNFQSCTVFAIRRQQATFLGATPERLLSVRGTHLQTEALAGSSLAVGEADATQLLANPKDLEEHRVVVEEIENCLGPLCSALEVPGRPSIRRLRHVLHLHTPIHGRLRKDVHVLELVRALHPTPAVGGVPSKEAQRRIRELEPCGRGWYAGPVGWFDAKGDGSFWVALRSAVVRGAEAWSYAGAGIMQDSDPHHEYLETALKQRTIFTALGVVS